MSERNLLLERRSTGNGKPLSAAQRLTEKTWDVFVSRSQVLSPQYAELLGVPVTNPLAEVASQHAGINTSLPISVLAEVYAIGGTPFFKNVRDTVAIYEDVCNYLLEFKTKYESQHFPISVSQKMSENVLKLENFAEWVFNIARPYFPDESITPQNSLAGRIGRGRFTRDLFKKKSHEHTPTGIPKAEETGVVHSRITDTTLEKIYENEQRVKRVNNTNGWH